MSTVSACAYYESDTGDTIATYYAETVGSQRMKDYLVGAASQFDIKAPIMQALGSLEAGGPGTNWLQLGPTAIDSFRSFWGTYNETDQAIPTTSQIQSLDALNAAGAAYWFLQGTNCGETGWEALLSRSSAYNGTCPESGCSCDPYIGTAYGWTALFLAYGSDYTVASTATYAGAEYVTAPTGTITRYLSVQTSTCGGSGVLTVPSSSTTRTLRTTPYGRNSNDKQIVVLTGGGDESYISGLQVVIDLANDDDDYTEPMVTSDADFAAQSVQNEDICVVALGGDAVTAIENACSSLGLSCESFSDFSAWHSTTTVGFINCDGSSAFSSYSLASTAAGDASSAGW